MGSWRRSVFLQIYEPNWRRLGAAAFKMVVGLLYMSPQLSRFFHTGTVFDSPALPNNCHKRLIIHYCLFVCLFFCINISSVTDVNSRLRSLCHRLTASPKFMSSCFFLLFSLPIDFISLFFLFCSLCFAFAWIHVSFSITVKNTESYLVTQLSKPHP